MKKYISLWLSVILLAGMLSGCLSSGNSNLASQPTTTVPTTAPIPYPTSTTVPVTQVTTPTTQQNVCEEPIPYEDHSISFGIVECDAQWPLVIRSTEDLSNVEMTLYGGTGDIEKYVTQFDEAFFEENTLIICEFLAEFYPSRHSVESFTKTGEKEYVLTVREIEPGYVELVMPCSSLVFIMIPGEIPEDAVITMIEI